MSNTNQNSVRIPKEQRQTFVLMYTLFFALFIWNLTNYLSLLWISDNWTTARQMVNYLLWPIILWILSGEIFQNVPTDKVYVKSRGWNYFWIIIIVIIVFIFCNLNIKFEEEKNICLKEQTKENLLQCIKEKEQLSNRFKLSKIF